MKKLFSIGIAIVMLLTLAANSQAQTNTNQTTLEKTVAVAKQVATTNLNEMVIDILRSGKATAGEIYSASKTALGKAVDFTMEQAPLVVKEFLAWRLARAIMTFLIGLIVVVFLFYCSVRCGIMSKNVDKYCKDDREVATGFKWIWRILALIVLMVNLSVNGMDILKITIAPRVYMIEYVVDTVDNVKTARR